MIPDLEEKTQRLFYISEYGVDDLDTIRYFSSAVPPIEQSDSRDQTSICLVTSYLNDIIHDTRLTSQTTLAAEQSLQYLAEQLYPSAQIQYGELMNERGNIGIATQFFDKAVHNQYYENETHKQALKKRIQCLETTEETNAKSDGDNNGGSVWSGHSHEYKKKSSLREYLRQHSYSKKTYDADKKGQNEWVRVDSDKVCHRGR
ncbi:MAG: hypothetical protein IKY98_00435 [Alphaproteobacteria bacterium]|nr:hypothetical protein [Alphaproteobacteria bacterium]